MNKPQICIIAAIGPDRQLGKNNQLLWHIPEDMRHFKAITSGHPVIMGQKTYQSIGRPLPNRLNIILSSNPHLQISGCTVCHSIDEAIRVASANDSQEIFFIGGGQIYTQALAVADKLYLTLVEGDFDADTYFPAYEDQFTLLSETKASDANFHYRFQELTKKVG